MTRRQLYSPEALAQLDALQHYLTARASPQVAATYLDRLMAFCETIADEPVIGHQRDDLIPGLLTRTFEKKRVVCFLAIDNDVHVLAIYGPGQNWEQHLLHNPPDLPE